MLNWAKDGNHILVPVESTKEFKELLKELPFGLYFCNLVSFFIDLAIIIKNVDNKRVKSISCHASELGS